MDKNKYRPSKCRPLGGKLPHISIPTIRRTFPNICAQKLCGVQPMSSPVGLAFKMRYKESRNKKGGFDSVQAEAKKRFKD